MEGGVSRIMYVCFLWGPDCVSAQRWGFLGCGQLYFPPQGFAWHCLELVSPGTRGAWRDAIKFPTSMQDSPSPSLLLALDVSARG